MKNKNIKIGFVAALSSLAAAQNCYAQTGNSNNAGNQNTDSLRLEQRLKELSQTKYTGELAWGAMCYSVAISKIENYVCPHCANTVRKYYSRTIRVISTIEDIVKSMKEMGYDVVLDKTEFCPDCSKKRINNPNLVFKIRFSTKADYHIAKSNIINEYLCLLAFLSDKDKYQDKQDFEHPLHDNIPIIQKMTGLGKDLKIEK